MLASIPISSVWIPDRIRENKRDAVELVLKSLPYEGQIVPIIVEEINREVYKDAPQDRKYRLIDGECRLLALTIAAIRAGQDPDAKKQYEEAGIKPGYINAIIQNGSNDPVKAALREFYANEARTGFEWKEKAKFVRTIHDFYKNQNPHWRLEDTAASIRMSIRAVSDYLDLSQPEIMNHEVVSKAETFREAKKKANIVKEVKRRIEEVKLEEKRVKEQGLDKFDFSTVAKHLVYHGDCREWLKTIPDESLSWFHWDPPYGTKEGSGGAFTAFEEIDQEADYAFNLMADVIPEIYRVLHDGAWLAIWYSPIFYERLVRLLQGHEFVDGKCIHCELPPYDLKLYENYSCRRNKRWRFWTNPYPNVWYKVDRRADGHEIQRFLTKETEFFLLAAKHEQKPPILVRSNRGNVFAFESIPRSERRHVNHKPAELLAEILSLISVGGELGGDAGVGSGSIYEAAFETGRRVIGAEIRESYWGTSVGVLTDLLKKREITDPREVIPWLQL